MALSLSRGGEVKRGFSTNGKSREEEVATRAAGARMARAIAGISGRINRYLPRHKEDHLNISKAIMVKIRPSIILRSTPFRQTIRPFFVNSLRETLTATRATYVAGPTVLTTFNHPV